VASSDVYAVDLWYITDKPVKKRGMAEARYGHQCQYLNGHVYVFGGFSHRDLPNEPPSTLASCERLSVLDDTWTSTAPMSKERAFAASIILDAQYIYVLGGMSDFTVLAVIEKYDTLSDAWETVFFELPQPLAKLGACILDRSSILVCGGMNADFEATQESF